MGVASIQLLSSARHRLADFFDGDVGRSFLRNGPARYAFVCILFILATAMLGPLLVSQNPADLSSFNLLDSFIPPWFVDDTWVSRFPLGTDDQGRDMLSAIVYGLRNSLLVGFCAITLSLTIGLLVGILAGFYGRTVETILMRLVDFQLTFPSILVALLTTGVVAVSLPHEWQDPLRFYVLIFSIGISRWPQFARVARSSVLVQRNMEYVAAARVAGVGNWKIMFGHMLPNILSPILVIATINIGIAIIDEATLSFLGVGLPASQPSIGTLVRIGNQYIYSGEWWIVAFPAIVLVMLVLSVNIFGDWLRDALNPKLR
jgi:peptide/nickel transport system permease protein